MRSLSPLLLLALCLSVAEALSRGGLASWLLARGGVASRGEAAGDWAVVSCWGPGVWPHPAHCSLFSVCRMTGSGVRGVLLRCPGGNAFVSRRWRCYPDMRSRCAERPVAPELLKAAMEMRIPRIDLSPRLGLCPFPKPYCSSDTTLTVCAPNHLLIGNVTCPVSCIEDEFGAFCDPEVGQGTTAEPSSTTTAKYSEALPVLDASLMESAMKITSHLGLAPANKNAGNQTTHKPVRRPAVPANTVPVFDLNGSPEDYYHESEQVGEDRPTFSKPTVVALGNPGPSTSTPLPGGDKDSEVFLIENVQSSVGAVMEQLIPAEMGVTDGSATSDRVATTEYSVTPKAQDKVNAELEKLEKEKLERIKLEKERLEKEKLEREKLERERLEKERLEKEKLEKERLEKEKLEKERLEKEKLEKERLEKEKLEKERLEKERLEKERLEKERLEKERLEQLEKEKQEKEKLEKEEKEKLEREKIEREKAENENREREKLEKEKAEQEKMEKERLEKEKYEKQKLEKEKLEREKMEKLEREKLEKEKMEKERLEKEKLEKLQLQKEEEERLKEQGEQEPGRNGSSEAVFEQPYQTSPFSPHELASVCRRPGLTCVNSNVLLQCSPDLMPLRAWNCASFFSRSALLVAKCDREKDSCVAAVDGNGAPDEDGSPTDSQPLCRRPGAQCADHRTLIHCSDDLRSATVAVCEDLFPGSDVGAVCDQNLDACVVSIGEDGYGDALDQSLTTSPRPAELPSVVDVTTTRSPSTEVTLTSPLQPASVQAPTVTERFPGKPHPSDDPNDTFLTLFPMLKDQCRKPGLRCYGGRVLEACEKDNPKPVYRMDCSTVLADSLDARCEEQSEGEATCMVALRRNIPLLKGGQTDNAPTNKDDIYTLELSVVDVTRTFEYDDSEIPPWKCDRVGQYCADDSTLLSCSADFSVEFALSCGAIAPQSVIAFCDRAREACVVKKISDLAMVLTGNDSLVDVANQTQNKTNFVSDVSQSPVQQADRKKPSISAEGTKLSQPVKQGEGLIASDFSPTKWDFSTISQLYPPDIPLSVYSSRPSKPQSVPVESFQDTPSSILESNCTKVGPICLDEFHLGSCSEGMELRYVLPCSALYPTDPDPYCDSALSACLPSSSRQAATTQTPTTAPKNETTATASTTTTTTEPPTRAPTVAPAATSTQSSTFIPQQIPPYPPFDYTTPIAVQFGTPPRVPTIQEDRYTNLPGAQLPLPLTGSNFPSYANLRPEAYTFFQRPGINPYFPQQSRLPEFLQTLIQNYGIRWPNFSQNWRPPSLTSFPLLNNILQSFSTLRPPALQQNSEYNVPGGLEPYDYNDPHYQQYAEKYSNNYAPQSYQAILPGSQLIKVERPVAPLVGGISPDMHSDILKYYTNMLLAAKQPVKQSSGVSSSNFFINRPKPQASIQSYLDRFLDALQSQSHKHSSSGSQTVDFFKSKLPIISGLESSTASALGSSPTSRRPTVDKGNVMEYNSGFQGSVSHVNPLTWVGKLEIPDADQSFGCKRPGMQCVDSDSLGACSKDLKLRYVIPCRNLLPFVSEGRPYCDVENDACGVLVGEEKSEYPTDFTSYP